MISTEIFIIISYNLFLNVNGECPSLGSDYGGEWHCYPPVPDVETPVSDGTTCVLQCYQDDIDAVICEDDQWVPDTPGGKVCDWCPRLPTLDNSSLVCSDIYISPNTTCSYHCHDESFLFSGEWNYICGEDGIWTGNNVSFSCQQRSVDESVLIIGGLLPELWPDFISNVDKFTGVELDSNSVPDLPSGTAYLTSAGVTIGMENIVVSCFGDMSCDDQCDQAECLIWEDDQVWFNPREDAHYVPPKVNYRENANSVSINQTVWIIGGKHYNQSLIDYNSVEIFNPKCVGDPTCEYWTVGPDIPTPVYDSCSLVYNNDIYISGGTLGGPPYVSKSFYKLDIETFQWQMLPDMTVDRYGHGCAVFKDKIYLSGGYSYSEDRLGHVEIFSPATEMWVRVADLLTPRNNHHMVTLNNVLTVIGGYGADPSEYWSPQDLDTIEEYHDEINEWILRNITLSVPRRSFGVAIIKN